MDPTNLQTASLYINNLLLSRGLLRNSQPIDFARPSTSNSKPGTDPADSTATARTINLIHDLLLRLDRDASQRENLALTIRALRTTESTQSLEIARLRTKVDDLTRHLATAEGQERVWKAQLRTAEQSCRALREEMGRVKGTLGQVRVQCANDLRKRDVQLARMKKVVEGMQQRGQRAASSMATITITPGATMGFSVVPGVGEGLDDGGYSLQQETTEFLTQLSQNLSDENDNLINLVRSSLQTLRSLQGLPEPSSPQTQDPHSLDPLPEEAVAADLESHLLHALPTSHTTLAAEMDTVLSHLRTLLTNPSFVPIEEVAVREDEIVRLREGWEKMESRWRETVGMMDEWRRRVRGGKGVDLEELAGKLGVLGRSVGVGNAGGGREEGGAEREGGEEELSDVDEEEEENEESADPADDQLFVDDEEEPDLGFLDEQIEEDEVLGVGLRPDGSILSEVNGNIQAVQKQDVGFSAIHEEGSSLLDSPSHGGDGEEEDEDEEVDMLDASAMAAPPSLAKQRVNRPTAPTPSSQQSAGKQRQKQKDNEKGEKEQETRTQTQMQTVKVRFASDSRIPRTTSQKRTLSSTSTDGSEPTTEGEKSAKRRRSPPPPSTTSANPAAVIRSKLEATRLEAEKAVVAASASAVKSGRKREAGRVLSGGSGSAVKAGVIGGGGAASAVKRKVSASSAKAARAARRRSTLSPEELESLIMGGPGG